MRVTYQNCFWVPGKKNGGRLSEKFSWTALLGLLRLWATYCVSTYRFGAAGSRTWQESGLSVNLDRASQARARSPNARCARTAVCWVAALHDRSTPSGFRGSGCAGRGTAREVLSWQVKKSSTPRESQSQERVHRTCGPRGTCYASRLFLLQTLHELRTHFLRCWLNLAWR